MKKIILISAILSIAATVFSQEENAPQITRSNEISLNYFHIFDNSFILNYERHFSKTSLFLSAGTTLQHNEEKEKTGGRFELQYRFYSRPKKSSGYKGIYVAPYLQYKYLDVLYTDRNYYYTYNNEEYWIIDSYRDFYNSMSFGFMTGVRLAISNLVSFDFSFGGGVRYTDKHTTWEKSEDYSSSNEFLEIGYKTAVMPRANFTLGIRF